MTEQRSLKSLGEEGYRRGQVMLTYKCTAACRHCLVMASPKQAAIATDVPRAVEYVEEFWKRDRWTLLAGGEALIFYDRVLEIIRRSQERGIPIAFVETNASWCVSDEVTVRRFTQMHEAGLMGMYFSLDPYHQEFIPVENVQRGVRIAEQVFGGDNLYFSEDRLKTPHLWREITRDERKLAEWVRSHPPGMVGRAAERLSQYLDPKPIAEIAKDNCAKALDLDSLVEIQVDPFDVVRPDMCSGIMIGNARQAPLSEIITTAYAMTNPVVRTLRAHGPVGLLEMGKDKGYQPRETYVSKCHLCWEVRKFLRPHYPGLFGPREIYEEAQ